MSKSLSTKYYQENKKRLQEKPCETYQNQNLSKEEKEKKNDKMVLNVAKISQKMKNKNEKNALL